jgi:hypothetical protein
VEGSGRGAQIRDLGPLRTLRALSVLDVGSNRLRDLRGVEELVSLAELRAGGNEIGEPSALRPLGGLQALRVLELSSATGRNPVVDAPAYRADVLRLVPHLHMLDGEHLLLTVAAQEAIQAAAYVREDEIVVPPVDPFLPARADVGAFDDPADTASLETPVRAELAALRSLDDSLRALLMAARGGGSAP